MGLGIGGIRLNLELYIRGFYTGMDAIADFGAQDLTLSKAELFSALKAACLSPDENDFARLNDFPVKRMSAEAFYRLLGFSHYTCLDIGGGLTGIEPHLRPTLARGGMRWNALKQDLNHPLAHRDLIGKFDVVTDYGNNEHVFDLTQAYKAQHDLCKVGGLMIIHQQMYHGNGYYCFNPKYYEAMAYANDYEIVMSFAEVNQNFISIDADINNHINPNVAVGVIYVFRKTINRPFNIARQNAQITRSKRENRVTMAMLPDSKPRTFVPMADEYSRDSVGGRDALAALVKAFRNYIGVSKSNG